MPARSYTRAPPGPEQDSDLEIDNTPQALYPPIRVPEPRELNYLDRARTASFKQVRDRCQKGPLHATLGSNVRVGKEKRPRNSDFFSNMSYQSMFAKKPPQTLPNFNTREYDLSMFPEELWHVLDPAKAPVKAKRVAEVEAAEPTDNESEEEPEDEAAAEVWRAKKERKAAELAKKEAARDYANRSDAGSDAEQDQDFEDELDPDENFSDEDDEMAGDYNAEQYFNDGEGDGDSMAGDEDNEGGWDD